MSAARVPMIFGGRRSPRASSDLSFLSIASAADLPAGSAFARAGSATRVDHRGFVASVGNDVMRHTYDPALTYNLVPNPWGDGGTIGTSTLPTGFSLTSPTGMTATFLDRGTADGVPYVDLRISGTMSGTVQPVLLFNPINSAAGWTPIVTGDKASAEAGVEILAVTTPRPLFISLCVGGASTSLNTGFGAVVIPQGAPMARYRATDSMDNGASTGMAVGVGFTGHQSGDAITIDFRVSFPVMTFGDGVYLTDTVSLATLAARVNGLPQYGLRGVLLEGATTNLVLNSATLVTQNVTTTNVAHTLSFYGTGTVTLTGTSTAGPLVGTGTNNRVSLAFTPTAGTLTLTVTGDVRLAQLEASVIPTSYVPTAGTTAARVADSLTLPASLVDFSKSTIAVCYALSRYGSASVLGGNAFSYGAGQHTPERVFINNPGDVPICSIVTGGVTVAAFPRAGGAAPRDTMLRSCLAWGDGSACHSWDGATAVEDSSAASPSPTGPVFRFNGPASGSLTQGASMVLRYVRVWSGRKLTPVQVRSQSARVL